MRRANFELLGGAFLWWRGLLTRRKRAPQMEWEFMYKVGRKRGGELTRAPAFTPHNHIGIFYGGWLSSCFQLYAHGHKTGSTHLKRGEQITLANAASAAPWDGWQSEFSDVLRTVAMGPFAHLSGPLYMLHHVAA